MWVYLVIDKNGIPIIQYPLLDDTNIDGQMKMNTILLSGLLSALNTLSIEATGETISKVNFGSIQAVISRDKNKCLHVVFGEENIPIEILREIHIQAKDTFLLSMNKFRSDDESFKSLDSNEMQNDVRDLFAPIFFLYKKKILNYNKIN
ncbi:MAG: hypothetical protein K9W44_10450 [Candidatus Lokiarchaeota archaeon]|nr:hypothetical protein [Candidatus Harpocratesius repetitus]